MRDCWRDAPDLSARGKPRSKELSSQFFVTIFGGNRFFSATFLKSTRYSLKIF